MRAHGHQDVDSAATVEALQAEIAQLRERIAHLTRSGHELISTQTRMQSLLHRATDAIIQFESDGTISSFNSAAERIFDYGEIELLHQHGNQLFRLPAQFVDNVPAYLMAYLRATPSQYGTPLIGLRRGGQPVLLEVSIAEIVSDDLVLFDDFSEARGEVEPGYDAVLCILRDITERKHIDEELRAYREDLESLVEAQVEQIRVAHDAAERANRAKSEFLASMSHELRTPMHAILSFSEFGCRKVHSAGPEKLEGYFSRIHASGSRLLHMIDDLLDLSKAEAGRLSYDFALSSLDELVRSLVHEMESLAEAGRIEFAYVSHLDDPYIEMDADRIGQVLRNLLSNAIKFSPPGGRIDIELGPALLESTVGSVAAVCMQVRDQGPGIPEDELERVFEKFVQSRNNDRQRLGTGLGLAIAHEIVLAHGGTVCAANRVSGGADFTTVLPRRRCVKASVTAAEAEDGRASRDARLTGNHGG